MNATVAENPPATREISPIFVGVAAWLVPGLGHIILRRWARGIAFFAAIGGLTLMSFHLRGVVFSIFPPVDPRVDPLAVLGAVGDAGTGMFYFLSHIFERSGPDISRAAGDYGTRLFAAAGVANFLCIIDACEIAIGRKQ
ncbi:MAG: DUF6677 family protein [Candidatus Acidiferrales bacterium]